jgi:hypothetical protein
MANADPGSATDTIQLAAGTYSLTIQNTTGHDTAGLTGDLNITSAAHTLIIQGAGDSGPNATVIDASQLMDRAFQIVNPGTTVVFQNLVIQGGLAQDDGTAGALPGTTDSLGGGILDNGATLTLTNVVLQNNKALGANGANGANGTSKHLTGHAGSPGHNALGGGLYAAGGSLTLVTSTLANNQAVGGTGGDGGAGGTNLGDGGNGGAGANGGSARGGGVVATGANLTLTSSTLTMNTAQGGPGGKGGGGHFGILAGGKGGAGGAGGMAQGAGFSASASSAVPGPVLITATGTTLSGNACLGGAGGAGGAPAFGQHTGIPAPGAGGAGGTAQGGGLYSDSATLVLTASTIGRNLALGGAGGAGGAGTSKSQAGTGGPGGLGGNGQGAGLYMTGSSFLNGLLGTLTNCTISTNGAQGGPGGKGGNGRTGGAGGTGGAADGGGFDAQPAASGALGLQDCTVAANAAVGSVGGAGGSSGGMPGQGQLGTGGGAETSNLNLVALNTIIAGNAAFVGPDVDGPFFVANHDLVGNASSSNLTPANPDANGNQVGSAAQPINPLLGALADNGGPTETMALLPGSPAINAGLAPGAPATDQRGVKRDAFPDIGAYEFQAAGVIATGADAGGGPQVNVYDADTGALKLAFFAYDPGFLGGVRVAVGDVTGNGVPDIITAPGPGGGPDIRVFDGKTGALIREFLAYAVNFTGGVYVAAGDVNGDGYADIVTGADAGGGPEVKVFSGKDGSVLQDFFAYAPSFAGGVRVAAGDVNGDGKADVITAPGPGGGPEVKVFSGADGSVVQDFFAYAPAFAGGVYVAAGDVNGDGKADVITGAGAGGGPQVNVYSGADGTLLESFFAYDPAYTGGVRVGYAGEFGAGGRPGIVTGTGAGAGPIVQGFGGSPPGAVDAFFAYDPHFLGGVFVGGG